MLFTVWVFLFLFPLSMLCPVLFSAVFIRSPFILLPTGQRRPSNVSVLLYVSQSKFLHYRSL
jgi:hypothetical protein